MAARKTVKQVDAEQNNDEARIAELERRVDDLFEMIVFLSENPHYRVGDYINERNAK